MAKAEDTAITQDKIVSVLAEIAFSGECEKAGDRLRALDMLSKHLGLYSEDDERTEVPFDVNINIVK